MSAPLDMGFEFHHGIWDINTTMEEHHYFDATLAEYVAEVFTPPESTLDLGCGKAEYLSVFLRAGWRNLLGVDGTVGLEEITNFKNIETHDLCEPLELNKKFKLVVSLEVGEHVPAEYETAFIDNVVHHAEQDILLSWAVEGQAGPGHVNCRNNDYIVSQFKLRGFTYNERVTSGLRDNCSLPWFKNTLMYFSKA